MSEDQGKIDAQIKASRLHALTQTTEWQEFEKLMISVYEGAITTLIQKDDGVSRGTVQCIETLWSKLYDGIRYGEKCRRDVLEKYKKGSLKLSSPDTEY